MPQLHVAVLPHQEYQVDKQKPELLQAAAAELQNKIEQQHDDKPKNIG